MNDLNTPLEKTKIARDKGNYYYYTLIIQGKFMKINIHSGLPCSWGGWHVVKLQEISSEHEYLTLWKDINQGQLCLKSIIHELKCLRPPRNLWKSERG